MSNLNSVLQTLGIQPKESNNHEFASMLPKAVIIGSKKLFIAIGRNETLEPHFHIFRSEKDMLTFTNGVALSFKSPKIIRHKLGNPMLFENEIKAINTYLNKKYDNDTTNWKFLVELWNINNKEQLPKNIKKPNY